MLAKYQVRDIRKRLAVLVHDNSVDDREFDIRIIGRNLLHDRSLCKSDPDNEVETAFGECTHSRFDRGRVSRFNVVQTYVHVLLGALYAFPCSSVERTIVLAANIEHDADLYIAAFTFRLDLVFARGNESRQTRENKE